MCFTPPRYQFYSMGVTPYEGIYIGTPWVLWRKCTDLERDDPVISPGLAMSRDGWKWRLLSKLDPEEGEYIPTGPRGSMDDRQIRMSTTLVVSGDEILFFYGQSAWPHVNLARVDVGLATLRLDGFVAMVADEKGGCLSTKPFVVQGDKLQINAACENDGSITVEILDENGNVLDGFSKDDADIFTGDAIRHLVTWKSRCDMSDLEGKVVRLRFSMNRCKLYSFGFDKIN